MAAWPALAGFGAAVAATDAAGVVESELRTWCTTAAVVPAATKTEAAIANFISMVDPSCGVEASTRDGIARGNAATTTAARFFERRAPRSERSTSALTPSAR